MGRAMTDRNRQCKAVVYEAEQYRRTGRGPTGFEMYYIRRQCKRRATTNGRCWQHADEAITEWEGE